MDRALPERGELGIFNRSQYEDVLVPYTRDDRKLWDKFQNIYRDLLHRTSTSFAPWYVVPADHKWYRDVAVAGIVPSKAQALDPQLPMPEIHPKQYELG
jgi:polyphosphate kinase 2 (PPK2 family)